MVENEKKRQQIFSGNRKISARQLRALLMTDWMGKLLLMLPGLPGKGGAGGILAGAAAGIFLSAFLCSLIIKNNKAYGWRYLSTEELQDSRKMTGCCGFVYGICFIYLEMRLALTLYLCGRTASAWLLPEAADAVLLLLPVILGCYLAWSGMEVRGRVSELTSFLIWGAFLFFLVLSLAGNGGEWLFRTTVGQSQDKIGDMVWTALYTTAAGFDSLCILPLALPMVKDTEEKCKKSCVCAVLFSGTLFLLAVLVCCGRFGMEGTLGQKWPVLSLMSSARLPGDFLQRWDTLMAGLLIFGLFLSAGSSIYYLRTILCFFVQGSEKSRGNIIAAAAAALAWAIALYLCKNENIVPVIQWLIFAVCVPVLLVAVLWPCRIESGKRKSRRKNNIRKSSGRRISSNRKKGIRAGMLLLLMLCVTVLSGCTARELESRCFPLVLEIGAKEEGILFTCAWPGSQGEEEPGMVSEEEADENQNAEEDLNVEDDQNAENDLNAEDDQNAEEDLNAEDDQNAEEDLNAEDDQNTEDNLNAEGTHTTKENQDAEDNENTETTQMIEDIPKISINNSQITQVWAKDIDDAKHQIQLVQDKYVDYSQVKAILWNTTLDPQSRQGRQVLEWLEGNPVFARNLLIFSAEGNTLELTGLQKLSKGQPGIYLENLYKNNAEWKEKVFTLEEWLY